MWFSNSAGNTSNNSFAFNSFIIETEITLKTQSDQNDGILFGCI